MIEKTTLELAKRFPKTAQAILKAFRNSSDREQAESELKANGVVLDWSGHQPSEQ